MRKRRWLPAMVLALILGGLAWLVLSSVRPEPVYQGKPLHYWLAGYDAGNYKAAHPKGPPAPTVDEANEAVRQIGTNAIPTLLRMLRERKSPLKSRLISLAQKQHFFPVEFWDPANQSGKAERAFAALDLGKMDIAPQLAEIYEAEPCVFSRQLVPEILSHAAPNAPETVPLLLRALTETNDAIVRGNAAVAIREIHPNPGLVVPALTKALNDSDPRVQAMAADALRIFGADARPAVPALSKLIAEAKAKGLVAASDRKFTSTGGMTYYMGPNQGFIVTYWQPRKPAGSGFITSPAEALHFMEEALKVIDAGAAARAGLE